MAIEENGRQFQFGISTNISRIKTGYYHLSKTQWVILKAKERTLTSFDHKVRRPRFGILGTQHRKETSRLFIRGQSTSTQHGKQPLEPSDAGPTLCLWWLAVSRWGFKMNCPGLCFHEPNFKSKGKAERSVLQSPEESATNATLLRFSFCSVHNTNTSTNLRRIRQYWEIK